MGILLDYYGALLTEKQAVALELYYNEDLSLAEIAEEMGISRQGVMAFLRQGEKHLTAFEEKLSLASRSGEINAVLEKMRGIVMSMPQDDGCKELLSLTETVSDMLRGTARA